MIKMILYYFCDDCPHFYGWDEEGCEVDTPLCLHAGLGDADGKSIDLKYLNAIDSYDIPEWCPLEDYEGE